MSQYDRLYLEASVSSDMPEYNPGLELHKGVSAIHMGLGGKP